MNLDVVRGLLEPLSFVSLIAIRRAVEEGTCGVTNLGRNFSYLSRISPPPHLSLSTGLLCALISATSETRPLPSGMEAIQSVRVGVMRTREQRKRIGDADDGVENRDRLVLVEAPRFGVVREVPEAIVLDSAQGEGHLKFSSVRNVEWDSLGDVTITTHPLRLAPRIPGIGVMPGGRVWVEFVVHLVSPRCAVESPGDVVDHPFCVAKGESVGGVEFFAACEHHFEPLLPQISFRGVPSASLMTSSMRAEMKQRIEQDFVAAMVARHSFLPGSQIICSRKSLTSSEIFHEVVSVRPFLNQEGVIKVLWVVVERGENTKLNGNQWSKVRLRGPLSSSMIIGPRWNKESGKESRSGSRRNIPNTIWDGSHERVPFYYNIDCTFDNQL